MFPWNQSLFLLLNVPAHPAAWLVGIITALAGSPVIVAPALLVGLWVWGVPQQRGGLYEAMLRRFPTSRLPPRRKAS